MNCEVLRQEGESAIIVFESSVQFEGGRYEANMPWKPDVPELVNNFAMAVSPLRSAEERLQNDTQKYIEIH